MNSFLKMYKKVELHVQSLAKWGMAKDVKMYIEICKYSWEILWLDSSVGIWWDFPNVFLPILWRKR